MTEKVKEVENVMPQLSEEDAERILSNVFKACGMPPNTIPLKVLKEKYRKGSRGEADYG